MADQINKPCGHLTGESRFGQKLKVDCSSNIRHLGVRDCGERTISCEASKDVASVTNVNGEGQCAQGHLVTVMEMQDNGVTRA